MKKSFVLLWVVIGLFLTSCANYENVTVHDNDSSLGAREVNNKEENGLENEDPLLSAETCSSEEQSSSEEASFSHDTPHAVPFHDFEDIERFKVAALGTKEQFEEFKNDYMPANLVTYDMCKNMALNINSAPIPEVKDGILEGFGGTFTYERNELDLVYRVNGIRYRFSYYYDYEGKYAYEGSPVLKDVSIGSAKIDLYQGDDCFLGAIENGTTVIFVVVDTSERNKVNLEIFDF